MPQRGSLKHHEAAGSYGDLDFTGTVREEREEASKETSPTVVEPVAAEPHAQPLLRSGVEGLAFVVGEDDGWAKLHPSGRIERRVHRYTKVPVRLVTCQYADRTVILMTVMPTARCPDAAALGTLAPAGQWRVRLQAQAGVSGIAHAYLARSDPNLGRGRRGRSGYLDSDGYDPQRYRRASEHLVDPLPIPPAAVLARGSLNGAAAGARTYVASGYCAQTSRPSPYSGGGPTRGARYGPSWAYPTDQSIVLRGVLATGNRSGTVTRLVGTSFAAPMLARDLWTHASFPPSAQPPNNPPAPPPFPHWRHHRFGNGIRE